jgi:hypothetical protein
VIVAWVARSTHARKSRVSSDHLLCSLSSQAHMEVMVVCCGVRHSAAAAVENPQEAVQEMSGVQGTPDVGEEVTTPEAPAQTSDHDKCA